MSTMRKQWRKFLHSKPLLASGLLALFLLVLAMAQSGTLHRLVHADAANPDHQCAVTLLATGQIDVAAATATVPAAAPATFALALPEAPLLAVADYSLLPGRAPPSSLS